ncbi:lipoyl domain-containing protein, partial [Xanthobacter flavus]|uniref:lipoyl domain-containing protein n=1 Tax=Xanthobacter flavus TaxID=281 RepID=UPI0037266E70
MTSAIVMPKLGLTMTEGLLASWRVQPGDQVADGDVLFVVETEKIATEITAQGPGRIETIEVSEGAVAPVGATVATWTGAGASAAAPEAASAAPDTPAAAEVPAAPAPAAATAPGGGRI